MEKKQDIRRLWLRKILKIYIYALFVSLGIYLVFAFLDPGLLSYDLRAKFHALAADTIIVTARALDPPVQPVVTGTAICNQVSGTLQIDLDWADDVNTYNYDIDRDNAPLVSSLINSSYNDGVVIVATTYSYVVTANGPVGPGFAISVPVVVTTPGVCEITAPAPVVTIMSFVGRNIDSYNGTPRVTHRRPLFTGTTSMANATILVTVGSSFIAQFLANSNGYWEWQPPYGVSSGSHVFTVTATDPSDGTRQATASLRFDTLKRDATDSSQKNDSRGNDFLTPNAPNQSVPLEFTLSVDESVMQGEQLHTKIVIGILKERYSQITVPIRYSVTDEEGTIIFGETRPTSIEAEKEILETFPIPLYIASGKYSLQAEVLLDTTSISRRATFMVQELPLIRLSSGESIAYADIIRQLGWIVFFVLILFFLWLAMFIREFALYMQGDREVTEYDLKRAGYFRK